MFNYRLRRKAKGSMDFKWIIIRVITFSLILLTSVTALSAYAKGKKQEATQPTITGNTLRKIGLTIIQNKSYNLDNVSEISEHLFKSPKAINSYFTGAPPSLSDDIIEMFSRDLVIASSRAAQAEDWKKSQTLLIASLQVAQSPLKITPTIPIILPGEKGAEAPPAFILYTKNFPSFALTLALKPTFDSMYATSGKNSGIGSLRKRYLTFRSAVLKETQKILAYKKSYLSTHQKSKNKYLTLSKTQKMYDMRLNMNKLLSNGIGNLINGIKVEFKPLIIDQEGKDETE